MTDQFHTLAASLPDIPQSTPSQSQPDGALITAATQSVERRRRFQPNHQQHQQQRAGERGREEFSSERGSVLRVKRKCDDDPIQALVMHTKRRDQRDAPIADPNSLTSRVFVRVGSVSASQLTITAAARDRVLQKIHKVEQQHQSLKSTKGAGSMESLQARLRASTADAARTARLKLISHSRPGWDQTLDESPSASEHESTPGLPSPAIAAAAAASAASPTTTLDDLFHLYDVVSDSTVPPSTALPPFPSHKAAAAKRVRKLPDNSQLSNGDVISCNSAVMSVEQTQENPEWVYDLYYAPKMDGLDAPINDLSEFIGIEPLPELLFDLVGEDEDDPDVYHLDSDDSNAEDNWRNDYPDEHDNDDDDGAFPDSDDGEASDDDARSNEVADDSFARITLNRLDTKWKAWRKRNEADNDDTDDSENESYGGSFDGSDADDLF